MKPYLDLRCDQCGAEFKRKPADARKTVGNKFWCSWACWKLAHPAKTAYPKIGSRHAHRVMAERKLGRPLRKGEIVHHEDENRLNYSEENLKILPSQSEHARLHFAGVPHTKEHSERIAASQRGKRLSESQKKQISESRTSWWAQRSEEERQEHGYLMRRARCQK